MTERVTVTVSMDVPDGETAERCQEYIKECLQSNGMDWELWKHFKNFYQLKIKVRL